MVLALRSYRCDGLSTVLTLTPSRTTAISIEKLFRFENPPAGFYGKYSGDAELAFDPYSLTPQRLD